MPILHWLTREADLQAARRVPYRLLEEVPDMSAGDRDSGNMLIQGDNLDALKALLPYYKGQVKCIFIDPPYNTGSAFEHYDDNLEHTRWLEMMYPRLELLRDLLSEDGLFFVQIDDHEFAYLTVICDEIFGRLNRMNVIAVKMSEATGVKMAHARKRLPKQKEYILVYKLLATPKIRPIRIPRESWNDEYNQILLGIEENELEPIKEMLEQDESNEQAVFLANLSLKQAKIVSLSRYFSKNSITVADQDSWKWRNAWRIVQAVGAGSLKQRAILARTNNDVSAVLSARHKLSLFKTNFDESSRDPRIRLLFSDKYLTYNPGDFWTDIKTAGGVGDEGGFSFPRGKKPETLMQRIFEVATNPGDLILDSFLGSGTTAAVAHKMGRRYIGIEREDHAVTHCAPRLQKVIEGEQGGISEAVNWHGGGGFRFYRLGKTVFDEDGKIRADIPFTSLAAHVWFAETGIPIKVKRRDAFLGVHKDIGYALLYNGILGDKSVSGGNVLTHKLLEDIRKRAGDFAIPFVIYGEASRISTPMLTSMGVTFKQTPYDIKAR
jgi:adenine-specific DNA-methyltransferase